MKISPILIQISLTTIWAFPALTQPMVSSSKPFTYDNRTYTVRTIMASGEGAVIEVGFRGADESGKVSTIYRQYQVLNSCRNPRTPSAYGFLGEHQVNDFGVVVFSNPQPEGGTIPANSGIGKVVGAAFTASCRN